MSFILSGLSKDSLRRRLYKKDDGISATVIIYSRGVSCYLPVLNYPSAPVAIGTLSGETLFLKCIDYLVLEYSLIK